MSKQNLLNLTNDKVSLIYLNTLCDVKVMTIAKQYRMYLVNTEQTGTQYLKALNNLVKRRTELLNRANCPTLTEYNEQAQEKLKVLTVIVDDAEICKKHKQLIEVLSAIQEFSVRVGIAIVMNSPKGYLPTFKETGNQLVVYGSSYELDLSTGRILKEVGKKSC